MNIKRKSRRMWKKLLKKDRFYIFRISGNENNSMEMYQSPNEFYWFMDLIEVGFIETMPNADIIKVAPSNLWTKRLRYRRWSPRRSLR